MKLHEISEDPLATINHFLAMHDGSILDSLTLKALRIIPQSMIDREGVLDLANWRLNLAGSKSEKFELPFRCKNLKEISLSKYTVSSFDEIPTGVYFVILLDSHLQDVTNIPQTITRLYLEDTTVEGSIIPLFEGRRNVTFRFNDSNFIEFEDGVLSATTWKGAEERTVFDSVFELQNWLLDNDLEHLT